MVIFKYKLEEHGMNEIAMPKGSRILCARVQDTYPHLWVLVKDNSYEEFEKRKFIVYVTGEDINMKENDIEYIETFQVNPVSTFFSEFVGHIFEIKKP